MWQRCTTEQQSLSPSPADRLQCCRCCATCETALNTSWQLLSCGSQETFQHNLQHMPHRWAGMWRPSTTNRQSLSSELLNRRWMAVRVRAGPQGECGLAGCFHHRISTAGHSVDSSQAILPALQESCRERKEASQGGSCRAWHVVSGKFCTGPGL